jgi:hypothetical protein
MAVVPWKRENVPKELVDLVRDFQAERWKPIGLKHFFKPGKTEMFGYKLGFTSIIGDVGHFDLENKTI